MMLLEQRRMHQREMLQQQMPASGHLSLGVAALNSKYPLSSAFLGNLQGIGGSNGHTAAGVPQSVTPPPPHANDAILRELQQQLREGNPRMDALKALSSLAAPTSHRISSPSSGASVGSATSSSLNALSREELLRQMVADSTGRRLGNMTYQQPMLGAAKRDAAGARLDGVNVQGVAKKLRMSGEITSLQQARNAQALKTNSMLDATSKLELKERADVARMMAALAYPASNMKQTFPLPRNAEEESENKPVQKGGAPKMESFRSAWDNVKSKEMQKEIFLRKLHAGTLFKKKTGS